MVSWTLASICFLKSLYLFPKLTKMMHMISNILNRYSVEGLNKPVSMHWVLGGSPAGEVKVGPVTHIYNPSTGQVSEYRSLRPLWPANLWEILSQKLLWHLRNTIWGWFPASLSMCTCLGFVCLCRGTYSFMDVRVSVLTVLWWEYLNSLIKLAETKKQSIRSWRSVLAM